MNNEFDTLQYIWIGCMGLLLIISLPVIIVVGAAALPIYLLGRAIAKIFGDHL